MKLLQEKFKQVRLELEPNKTFLLRPTVLLLFEKALIEPGDVSDLESKKNESPWHKLCYDNAMFLINEGIVEIKPVNIPIGIRSLIKKTGEDLSKYENRKLLISLLEHAWLAFDNYISIKSFYLRSNQNLLVKHVNFREEIAKMLKRYSKPNEILELDDKDLSILRQIIWKTHASIEAAISENSSLFMELEYRPFITYLLKNIAGDNKIFPKEHIDDIEKLDELLIHVSRLHFPSTKIDTDNEKRAFVKLRKSTWHSFNELCNHLNDILFDSNFDVDVVKKVLNNQSDYSLDAIQARISKLDSIAIIGTFISRVLLNYWGLPTSFGKEPMEFAKNQVIGKKLFMPRIITQRIPWYQASAESFSKSELSLIKGEISKYKPNPKQKSTGYWFDNPDKLPWYVDNSIKTGFPNSRL